MFLCIKAGRIIGYTFYNPDSTHYFTVFGSTLKQGCTAGIKLILSDDGQYLEVTEIIGEHNHAVHQVSASLMCVTVLVIQSMMPCLLGLARLGMIVSFACSYMYILVLYRTFTTTCLGTGS